LTCVWDLSAVSRLDSAAAVLLWRTWGGLAGKAEIGACIDRCLPGLPSCLGKCHAAAARHSSDRIRRVVLLKALANLQGMIALFGQLLLDGSICFRHPPIFRGGIYGQHLQGRRASLAGDCTGRLPDRGDHQLPVGTAVASFGADLFIVNILGISIIRELGPVLVAVLVAGRSGSAMTAQIGVMRVTEEIDACRRWAFRAACVWFCPKFSG
jgi:phospholipid/cholesterol/gamma-HCH transport system permease protein